MNKNQLPLPKFPTYELILPSTNKKIKYRPFVMQEEKILLMANESNDPAEIISAIRTIIQSCILTPNIDIENLAAFDLEWIFLKLRMASVGETVDIAMKHDECPDHITKVPVDLRQAKVDHQPGFRKTFELGDGIGLTMRYPTAELLNKIDAEKASATNTLFDIIASCVDKIHQGDIVHNAGDFDVATIVEWLMHFSRQSIETIIDDFFGKLPVVSMGIKWTCSKCHSEHATTVRGIQDFFG